MATIKHLLGIFLILGLMGFAGIGHAKHRPAPTATGVSPLQRTSSSSLDSCDVDCFAPQGQAIEQKKEKEEEATPHDPAHLEPLVYITIIPRPAIELKPASVDEPVTPRMVTRYFVHSIPAIAPPLV